MQADAGEGVDVMYKSHEGHYTYKVAGKSSADPRRRCLDCNVVFNPSIRREWTQKQEELNAG